MDVHTGKECLECESSVRSHLGFMQIAVIQNPVIHFHAARTVDIDLLPLVRLVLQPCLFTNAVTFLAAGSPVAGS